MSPALGATHLGGGRTEFLVWAPRAQRVEVRLLGARERWVPLSVGEQGYHHAVVEGAGPGCRYFYRLDGDKERPDPASRFQPEGVHGPSEVVDSSFDWHDSAWRGLPLEQFIQYEIHVGAFTAEGTLDAIVPRLDELKDLGITAIELMPVAQFPGKRNWGYDGVFPFAVQDSYGGPPALKKLVDACHARGLAVVLDVVYNHLGPEGNYLADFGPYFTDFYRTPWGPAVNYDRAESDEVRRYFIEDALYWITEFHVDALRLDAVHAIVDPSARPFLQELGDAVHRRAKELQRRIWVIPESDRNDARMIRSQEAGGLGLDAQWSDDFHHALHTLLTGEKNGYYIDFGKIEHLARALTDGFVYSGEYSAYRRRRHGNDSRDIPAHRFVVCAQNHDQVGNRMLGERLSQLVSFDGLKLAAGVVLLSPFVPLLFMGEEYGGTAPFLYFVHHSDPGLVEAVRKGRREEFSRFQWRGEVPDPQDEETFLRSKLNYELRGSGEHRVLNEFYKELIRLRKELPSLAHLSKADMEVAGFEAERALYVRRWSGSDQAFAVYNFSDAPATLRLPVPSGKWHKLLDSADARWGGSGGSIPNAINSPGTSSITISPKSLVLFHAD
jgi:maltooligosyltrehalose trehalohydrolase